MKLQKCFPTYSTNIFVLESAGFTDYSVGFAVKPLKISLTQHLVPFYADGSITFLLQSLGPDF